MSPFVSRNGWQKSCQRIEQLMFLSAQILPKQSSMTHTFQTVNNCITLPTWWGVTTSLSAMGKRPNPPPIGQDHGQQGRAVSLVSRWVVTVCQFEVLHKLEMHNRYVAHPDNGRCCSSGVNSIIAQTGDSLLALKQGRWESLVKQSFRSARGIEKEVSRPDKLVGTEACAPLNGEQARAQTREILGWIRVARTARKDARRSGIGDVAHTWLIEDASLHFMWNTIQK